MGKKNRILRYFKKFGKKYANHPYIKAKLKSQSEKIEPVIEEKLEEPKKEKVLEKKSAIKKTITKKKPTTKTRKTRRSKPKAE
mgnify:CR=1 FL=1|tara:strand:+ start:413 stop:661 length:249 start_codon:yes stop_codon:yes gene_type:complete